MWLPVRVVFHGPTHYRQLESDKINALKKSQVDYDAPVTLSNVAQRDLHWWIQNIQNAKNPIKHPNPIITLESDASNMGWGSVYQTKSLHSGVDGPAMNSNDTLMPLK